jgi:hypothetical protein
VKDFMKARPSPAMVVALIALFVALGGTATALSGSNTVFSDDIVNNEVQSADVRDGSLRRTDLGGIPLFSRYVARPKGNSSVSTTGDSNAYHPYPLTNNHWTQAANETDLLFTKLRANAPAQPTCGLNARIFVDGRLISDSLRLLSEQYEPSAPIALFDPTVHTLRPEPGSPTTHTLTARVGDGCSGDAFTVTAMQVSVMGFR